MFKKIFISIFIFLIIYFTFETYAVFQTQGFTSFQENYESINFECTQQCIAILGTLGGNDYLHLQGFFEGQGTIGFGFLIGQQVVPGPILSINGQGNLYEKFKLYDIPFFSQIPKNAQVVLLVQGNVKGYEIRSELKYFSLFEKFDQGWKEFWTFDTFKPYTINLLYGPRLFGQSANKLFYLIFVIIGIGIFLLTSYSYKKKIFLIILIGGIFWLIYDMRMSLEFVRNYYQDYHTYISASGYQKIYRDRGDFYSFVDFTKQVFSQLGLSGTEKIVFYTDNTWPFPGSMKYFLYPYDVHVNTGESKYYVVYQAQGVQQKNNQFFYYNKNMGTGTFYQFSPHAFIFVRH